MILVYNDEEYLVIMRYYDAIFQTDHDDSKSQTGYMYMLNNGAVC
jgi:hypothetical protein